MTAELVWEHPTSDIPKTGLTGKRTAAPDELEAVVRALGLGACPSLDVSYAITPIGEGRYALSGTLRAEVVQTCVVTLDPVTNTIEEGFEAEFWPEEDITPPRGGVLDLDEAADPEPIVAGQIAIGRIVFECLAENLDPYPRKPGATLDWRAPASEQSAGGNPEGPFAVLANMKTRR
jgi:uncharacterized protein DUF177 involved in 23S rRNA accumulation